MGRWIERRGKHKRRALRFEAMWGWPYSMWFILWLALFFGQFFLRLFAIWVGQNHTLASPSFNTLSENIAFSRAFDDLQKLPSPTTLANTAASSGDFRTLGWTKIRKEKYQGTLWVFTPLPVRQVVGDYRDDVSFKIALDTVSLCDSNRVNASYAYKDRPEAAEVGPEHLLSTLPAFCQALRTFEDGAYVLEERGYNGYGPYISREVVAFYARFLGFLQTYNRALAKHPQAPRALKNNYFRREAFGEVDYELHADGLSLLVPEAFYTSWIAWD